MGVRARDEQTSRNRALVTPGRQHLGHDAGRKFSKPHAWERMSGELQGVLERGRGRNSLGTASGIINLIRSSISEFGPEAHRKALTGLPSPLQPS